MRVSEVETNASGEVVHYSCPECGSALVMERVPQHTGARFRCVNCEEETTTPTPDLGRTTERLYSVRVEIAFDDHTTAGILCGAEERSILPTPARCRRPGAGLRYRHGGAGLTLYEI
jgi:hypothetical protein